MSLKLIQRMQSGMLFPHTGAIRDGLGDYPVHCNKITGKSFGGTIPADPVQFALVAFRLNLKLDEALEVVANEIIGHRQPLVGDTPLAEDKTLVFGRLRHVLGKIPIKHLKCNGDPLPVRPGDENVFIGGVSNPILILGDTVQIISGSIIGRLHPMMRYISMDIPSLDLVDIYFEIPSGCPVIFVAQ